MTATPRSQGTDPANCWLAEVNRRLELRATSRTLATPAYYVSNGWRIDSMNDFSFKVGFYWARHTDPMGWLTIGLTPDIDDVKSNHVEFRVGSSKSAPRLWYEAAGR
jgi:hypothetical protein